MIDILGVIIWAVLKPFEWFYEILVVTNTYDLYMGAIYATCVFALVLHPILNKGVGLSDSVKKGKKDDN